MHAIRRWIRHHRSSVDCGLAVLLFLLGVLSVRVFHDIGKGQPNNFRFGVGIAVMALLTLPLAVRRRYAPVSLVCCTAAIILYTVFGITEAAMTGSVAFLAIYSVGVFCRPTVANWVRGLCIAALFGDLLWVLLYRQIAPDSNVSLLLAGLLTVGTNLFFFGAAWAIGDVARTSHTRAHEVEVRNADLQAAQGVIAAQAVLDERVRIARELHDVVAHHVSVMGVQAGAARRVLTRSPEDASTMLISIEESSRQAVGELQRLLGFLRSEDDEPAPPGAPAAPPQPSLSQLDQLVSNLREAGLIVTVECEGLTEQLPASIDLSAFRLVQEALTNALKHGGVGTITEVKVHRSETELRVSVLDDGRGRSNGRTDQRRPDPALSKGHGIIGMRERVALHNGVFRAAHRPGSGFAVEATFPLPVPARAPS